MKDTPILWGRGSSSNVQKVLWAVAELDLDVQRRTVGGQHGGTETEAFFDLNPNRTVPVWQYGDFVLWESQAILRHIARQNGRLYGSSECDRATIDCWLDWSAIVFWPNIRLLFQEVFRAGITPSDHKKAPEAIDELRRLLVLMDGQLLGRDHLVGAFSLADIAQGICVNRMLGLDHDIELPAQVSTWFQRIAARSSFALATMDEFDMPGHRGEQQE